MLIITALGGYSLRIAGGKRDIVVFPEKVQEGEDLLLLAAPEERPRKTIISWPGEYDVAEITIRGIGHDEGQRVSYVAEVEGVRCAFPVSPLHDWSQEDIERLGEVHVLALPGEEDPKLAQKLIDEIDPRMLLLLPGTSGTMNAELLKACGAVGKEAVKEYKLKGSFAAEGREVVVFGS